MKFERKMIRYCWFKGDKMCQWSHKKDKKNMIRRVGSTDERKIWKMIAAYKDYKEC